MQVPKSLITIVVGNVTEDLKSAAAPLKNRGVQMFVIADTPSAAHVNLASGRNFMREIDTLDELGQLSARLAMDTCEGKFKMQQEWVGEKLHLSKSPLS